MPKQNNIMTLTISNLSSALSKSCAYVFAAFGAFFFDIQFLILLIGICIFADTGTGIFRAHRQKKAITSRGLSQLVSKMVLYQGCIILFFILDKYLLNEIVMQFTSVSLFLTKFVAIVLCSIEVISINENISLGTNGRYDFFKKAKEIIGRGQSLKNELDDFVDINGNTPQP